MAEQRRLMELALKGLEAEQASLQAEIAAIRRGLGSQRGQPAAKVSQGSTTKGKRLSAAHRRRISAAMKLRYAQKRGPAAPAVAETSQRAQVAQRAELPSTKTPQGSTTKGKRLSAAHRRRISAAMKLRYAQKRGPVATVVAATGRRGVTAQRTEAGAAKAAPASTTKGKRLSAAHRRKISAAMKSRYAQKRGAIAPASETRSRPPQRSGARRKS